MMAGMRDRIVHDYFGINHQVVWDAVRGDLSDLVEQVESILQTMAADEAD